MVDSFSALKRNRETALERLTKEASKLSSGNKRQEDDRFWQPQVDKSGNGYAVIRFLPAPQGEDVPWVRIWTHGFQGPGGWYIENCLTTLGKADPVHEMNMRLYAAANKNENAPEYKQAQNQKRKLGYIANILVVKDAANPENEGKVFLYRFGKKIFDKINAKMNPEFQDDVAINPFDFWSGCNFRLKIRTIGGYRNYDESAFDTQSAISSDDSAIERIWKSEYSLQEFIAPDKFKSYDELKARLNRVLDQETVSESKPAEEDEMLTVSSQRTAEPKGRTSEPEDDDLARFRSLADED